MTDVTNGLNLPETDLGEFETAKNLEIGHNIELISNDGSRYYRILNKEAIPFLEKTDDAWAIAAGSSYEISSMNDYLETGRNQLYILGFGVWSDVDIDVIVRMVGTTGELYGIKQSPTGKLNPTSAPYENPRVVVKAWEKTIIPSFKIENNTKYDANLVRFSFIGYKFSLERLPNKPQALTPITLVHVAESGRP